MKNNLLKSIIYVLNLVLGFSLFLPYAFAGNPLKVNSNGIPVAWDNRVSIRYKVDAKGLGRYSYAESLALIQKAMKVWEDVDGAGVRFEYRGPVGEDINGQNWNQYASQYIDAAGQNFSKTPSQIEGYLLIVFDDDGSIIPRFTSGDVPGSATITGYTGPLSDPQAIKSATLFLNGKYADGDATIRDMRPEDTLAVMVHELGHVLGLNHSVFNHTIFNDIVYGNLNPNNARYLPSMFPSVIRGYGHHAVNLHPDDIATLKWIYRAPELKQVAGQVFNASGVPQYSMVVTARSAASPLCMAFSQATSVTCNYQSRSVQVEGQEGVVAGSVCETPSKMGYYQIPILEYGDYALDVGEINTLFGTSVISQFKAGSYPQAIPGGAELFNEADAAFEGADEYDIIALASDSGETNFVLASDTASDNRKRRVHHSFFEDPFFGEAADDDAFCPQSNPVDLSDILGPDANLPADPFEGVPVADSLPDNAGGNADASSGAGGGCSLAGPTAASSSGTTAALFLFVGALVAFRLRSARF